MKISERWLREFVDLRASARELADRLTLVGLEVASVEDAIPHFDGVVIAKVETVEPHPTADKLKVCRVTVGSVPTLQIVCGAPNVRAGMTGALVRAGSRLPDGKLIQASRLRGVESQGMLCSPKELGLGDDHSWILELPSDIPAGQPLLIALGGSDKVLDIEITPNRGDALSMLGIARELGAIYDLDVHMPDVAPVPATVTDRLALAIDAPDGCQAFTGRVIRGLHTNMSTPLWMTERLRRAGLRSVSPLVDVTQHVMLEVGQPMHAYDLAKIRGGLRVRLAKDGESLVLLNGTAIVLQPDMLVIADDSGAVGLAGIMGGQGTAVSAETTDIFLESACFAPPAIQGRARRIGLATDAGYRFERGVDPQGQVRALERATWLLQAIAGGTAGPIVEAHGTERTAASLILRPATLKKLLGIEVPADHVSRILQRLGFEPERTAQGWQITAPSWRYDIEIEEDLVEEVGRLYGYENIPADRAPLRPVMTALPEERLPVGRLREVLASRGYQEIVSYSFVDGASQKLLTGEAGWLLANPISDQMTELRTSLWPGLVQALTYNLNRQQPRVRIFEIGNRFIAHNNEIKEELSIAGLVSGPQYPLQWGESRRHSDFFDMRSDIEALMSVAGHVNDLDAVADVHAGLQPGQAARLRLGNVNLGWMGALHPTVMTQMDIQQPVLLFELALSPLLQGSVPRLAAVPRFPQAQRDLSLVVPDNIAAASLLAAIRAAAGPLLVSLRIFDVYRGNGVDSSRKSIALGLIFQDYSRTLTDSNADELISRITTQLERELGVTIRD